jgi:hypothetical protein
MQSGVFPNAKSRGKSFPREIDRIEVAESLWNEKMVASQREMEYMEEKSVAI